MAMIDAWVASGVKQKLVRQQVDLGPLGVEEVEVQVENCGLCHSDLSMLGSNSRLLPHHSPVFCATYF